MARQLWKQGTIWNKKATGRGQLNLTDGYILQWLDKAYMKGERRGSILHTLKNKDYCMCLLSKPKGERQTSKDTKTKHKHIHTSKHEPYAQVHVHSYVYKPSYIPTSRNANRQIHTCICTHISTRVCVCITHVGV